MINEPESEKTGLARVSVASEVVPAVPDAAPAPETESGVEVGRATLSDSDEREEWESRQLAEELGGGGLFVAVGIYLLSVAISLLVIFVIVRAIFF